MLRIEGTVVLNNYAEIVIYDNYNSEMDIEEEEVQEDSIVREEFDEKDLWGKHKTTPVIEESMQEERT